MKKKVIWNVGLNVMATAIPTIVLQLIILPSLARKMDADYYGLVVTVLALLNVVPSTIGNVVNNVRLMHQSEYSQGEAAGDFQLILALGETLNVILLVILSVLYMGIKNPLDIMLVVLIGMAWLMREYLIVTFLIALNYKFILLDNIFLVLGYGVGLFLYEKTGIWQLIYLIGYLFSLTFICTHSTLWREPFRRTKLFPVVSKDVLYLTIATVLGRMINYADKMLLYPLLGGALVSIYYAATVLGKVTSMVITPINGVLLSYLSKIQKKPNDIFRRTLVAGAVVCFCGYWCAILVSGPVLRLLYPAFATEAMKYIYITCGTVSINTLSALVSPFVLKYYDTRWQIWIGVITTSFYVAVGMVLLKKFGLTGFCVGALLTNAVRLVVLVYIYYGRAEKQTAD